MKFERTNEIGLGLQYRAAFPHILEHMIEQWGQPLTTYPQCYYHYNFIDQQGQHFEIQLLRMTTNLGKKNLKKNCHCFYIYAKENVNIEPFINWIVEELQLLASLVVVKQQEPDHVKQMGVSTQATPLSEAC